MVKPVADRYLIDKYWERRLGIRPEQVALLIRHASESLQRDHRAITDNLLDAKTPDLQMVRCVTYIHDMA